MDVQSDDMMTVCRVIQIFILARKRATLRMFWDGVEKKEFDL